MTEVLTYLLAGIALATYLWLLWRMIFWYLPAMRRAKDRQERIEACRLGNEEARRLTDEGRYAEAAVVLAQVHAELDQIHAELREEERR